jgi:DNA polymerase-3 subunit delta
VAGIIFAYGDDEFLVDLRAGELASGARRGGSNFPVEVLDGRPGTVESFAAFLKNLTESLEVLPLFSREKVLWIRSVDFLGELATWESGEILEKILAQLARAGGLGVTVVLSACPVDRRLKTFKRLLKISDAQEVHGRGIDAVAIVFEETLKRKKIVFSEDARRHFFAKVGTDARFAAEELEKLDIFLGSRRSVQWEDVAEVICDGGTDDFFEPVEAFYRRNGKAYTVALEKFFANRGEPRALLAAIQSRNRLLIQMKTLERIGLWKVDGRGMPSQMTLKRAAERRRVAVICGKEKDPCDIFSQNSWYLGRLSDCLDRFTLGEFVHVQRSLLRLFEDLIRNWQEVSFGWLVEQFSLLL